MCNKKKKSVLLSFDEFFSTCLQIWNNCKIRQNYHCDVPWSSCNDDLQVSNDPTSALCKACYFYVIRKTLTQLSATYVLLLFIWTIFFFLLATSVHGDLFTPFNFTHCVCNVTNEDPVQPERYEILEKFNIITAVQCKQKLYGKITETKLKS